MTSNSPAVLARSFCLFLLILVPSAAVAGGPRWFTGPPFYTASEGQPVPFFTPDLLYYTDPGDLSASVSHAQADAMVAAAAATWNVPVSRLTLAQGGTLAEHLSSANVYFEGSQLVWPADVQAANYRSRPIAVLYDTNGSVIETLLGNGASDPAGCRQNAVVESVDGLDPDGTLHHALLILNGRCAGAAPDDLLQMRYQLTRTFGRILGIAWSQLNDNVFTGTPTPTLAQVLNWPLMHPIDVVCGPYTYKCMAQPFTLRPDDLSALAQVYPVTSANIIPGKTLSGDGAINVYGKLLFPTGQGMDAVNVVVTRRLAYSAIDAAPIVSAVSGMSFQQVAGNPVTGAPSGAAQSNGKAYFEAENAFGMRVPLPGPQYYTLFYKTEPINPLYIGEFAVGPYLGQPTEMSGPSFAFTDDIEFGGSYSVMVETLPQAAASCNPGSDGTESVPAPADASGFWSGQLCDARHTSWWAQNVQPGRTWTLEVTATDQDGVASMNKAHPLLGVWNATDARGTLPTVAATASAFNSQAFGTTQLFMEAAGSSASVRIGVADDRGHGRPDFSYRMRVLYADSVSPAQLGAGGGRITITGEGFRTGNRVTVNGVAATVVSISANSIVAIAPNRSAARASSTDAVDVAVLDATTGGSTVMQSALSYAGTAIDAVTLVSAPGRMETGVASGTPLAVQVIAPDGVTPVAGASVRFSVTSGSAMFTACGAAACTLMTDAAGYARSTLTATVAGTLALTATELSGGASVQVTSAVTDPVRLVTLVKPATRYLAAGSSSQWTLSLVATQDGIAATGIAVTWTAGSGLFLGNPAGSTDNSGTASVAVFTPGLVAGAQATVQGCVWTNICASSAVVSVAPSEWTLHVTGGAGQSVPASATLAPVTLQVTDASGHPLQGAAVTVYQTVYGWEGPCPATGRCPAAPVLTASRTAATSDAEGNISITPLEQPGVASVVQIAVAAGTQGFTALSLVKTP